MRKGLRFQPFLGALLLAAAITGCSTTGSLSTAMAGMQGQPVADVLAAWGETESTKPDGEQTLMTWRDYAPGLAERQVVLCERWLAVDQEGTVTGWRWRGDACEHLDATARANGAYALVR